jgi:flagellar hook-basal body complex protein FliE
MSMNLSGIKSSFGQIQTDLQAPAATLPSPAGAEGGASFKDILSGAIGEVENSRSNAADSVQQFLSGSGEDLHSTILATQRADLEFQMFMQVRNKVVSAYQEIMKMQM